jgi:thiol:disulfide interchange protein DsbD
MVPILSGIIAGQGPDVTTRKAFTLSMVYVLAMALTYTMAGVIAGLFGKNLQAVFQDPWIISGFAGLFVLLSLSMFGYYELQLPASWQGKLAEISGRREGGTLIGAGIMGFFSALIVGPCVAPPLAAALIVIGTSGDATMGGGALFSMALGMGVPLIIIGTSAGRILPRAGAWMDAIKAVFGVGLLALAIWMLERILSGTVIMLLWGALAIGSGIFMGALDRLEAGVSGLKRVWKTIGLALLLIGAAEIVGALSGGDDWQRPLRHLGKNAGEMVHVQFTRIKSIEDLNTAVAEAATDGKTVMLDFYADWCVECKRMEKTTFEDPKIVAMLSDSVLLQADVTAFDGTDEALVRHFSLYGPPAILFFDRDGRERPGVRMIGYMNAEAFAGHLEMALGIKAPESP